jgi:hypothetical protein
VAKLRLQVVPACSLALALLSSVASCGGPRASRVPLGGTHEPPAAAQTKAAAPTAVASAAPTVSAAEEADAEVAEVVPTVAAQPAAAAPDTSKTGFQFRAYTVGQAWTRSFDLEFNVKAQLPGQTTSIDMKMLSHQEARFEVLSVAGGGIDKLQINYVAYTSHMEIMGSPQDEPEPLAGKRYVISFANGKPKVLNADGSAPPKGEVESVQDDAREPAETEIALRELTQLAAKGKGDFTPAGAAALAGGEDENTKLKGAKASLRQLTSTSAHGEKTALLELSYALTNSMGQAGGSIEAQLSGTLLVADAPPRYQSSSLQGPLTLHFPGPGGASLEGRGTTKVVFTYRY